ncbi:MAG: hypothetical protein E3J21_05055 [Anaerolineales bacterium]|nr:MAG: hypothetical protein E3J21_05055 [Anaerolineales bacterium]
MEEWKEPIVLTRQEFAVADALARELAPDVDRNELGKVISYFQRTRSREKLFDLLDRLPRSGYVRSKRTRDYLRRIAEACRRHLRGVEGDRRALAVLGWSFRLMTRYQTETGKRYARGRQKQRR